MNAHQPQWLNGWHRSSRGWELEALVHQEGGWGTQLLPAVWLLNTGRLFEPSVAPFDRLPSRSVHLRIPDLSNLSPLMKPARLLTSLVPAASQARQTVYALADNEQRFYLPAALLLRELWMWSVAAMEALLVPNSLALYLRKASTSTQTQVDVTGLLARAGASDTGLRRLCWLAQCEDARASWASVLTCAHRGNLNLRLPQASLDAWAWGVELPFGTLVAELSSVSLSFELPQEGCRMRTGKANVVCPPRSSRRPGWVSF